MKEEAARYGSLSSLVMPRPNHLLQDSVVRICSSTGRYKLNTGAGFVYVQFATEEDASKFAEGIQKRAYYGRRVIANFYSDLAFNSGIYL